MISVIVPLGLVVAAYLIDDKDKKDETFSNDNGYRGSDDSSGQSKRHVARISRKSLRKAVEKILAENSNNLKENKNKDLKDDPGSKNDSTN